MMYDKLNENFTIVDESKRNFDWSEFPKTDYVAQDRSGSIWFYESCPIVKKDNRYTYGVWSNQSNLLSAERYTYGDENPNWEKAIQRKPELKRKFDKILDQ